MVSSVDGHTKDYIDSKYQSIESQVDGIESNIASLQSVTFELQTNQEQAKSNIQLELDSIRAILKKLTYDLDGIKDALKDLKKAKSIEETTNVTQGSEPSSPPLKKRRVAKSKSLKAELKPTVQNPLTTPKKRTPTGRASTSGRKRKVRVNENRYAELVSNGLVFGTIAKISSSRDNGEQWHSILYDKGGTTVMDSNKLKRGKRLYSVFHFLDPGKDSKKTQPVSCRIAKHFDACEYDGKFFKADIYFGSVIGFDLQKRKEFWTVSYDEGDDEVMNKTDFEDAIWLYGQNKDNDDVGKVFQKQNEDGDEDLDFGSEDSDDSELQYISEEETKPPPKQKKMVKRKEVGDIESNDKNKDFDESKLKNDVEEEDESTQDVDMEDVSPEKKVSKPQDTQKTKETTESPLKSAPRQLSTIVVSKVKPPTDKMPPKKREVAPESYFGKRVAVQRGQTFFRATVKDFGETCGEKCWEVVYDVSNTTEAWNEIGLKKGLKLMKEVGDLKEDLVDNVKVSASS